MAPLTAARNTRRKGDGNKARTFSLPVKANTKIYAGSLVVVDAGYAAPGRTATGLKVVGRAKTTVDNTGGAAGDKTIEVERGVFKWANSAAGDLIAQADVLNSCFIVDDQTVAKTDGTGTRSAAGTIVQVDSDGVWVE